MAIDSRNLSIEGVEGIVQDGINALRSLNADDESSNLLLAIERIKSKILFLQGVEEKMLSLFSLPNDRESIRTRVIEYNNENFNVFFGVNLKETFIDSFFRAAKSTKDTIQQEQNLLAEYIIQQINKNLDSSIPKKEIATEIARQFNFTISAVMTEGGTRFATRKLDTIHLEDGVPHILVDRLTPAMRERLQQVLNELKGEKSTYKFPNLDYISLSGFQTNKNSLNIQVTSRWFSEIKGMTASDIQKKIEEDPKKWNPVVDKANNNIIQMLCKQVGSEVSSELREYLQNIVNTDSGRYIFFIGKSTNEITGLLGEINAVLAIQKLTGKKVSIDWVAHNKSDGKKVSIDIVLKKILGINVKNTAQNFSQYEGFHNVKFVDRDPQKVLEILLDENNLSNALGDAFQTSYFNMSYQIVPNRPHVRKGSNSNFDHIESKLLNFRQHLITYLYQFAPEMLYTATDDLDKQLLVLDNELDRAITGAGNILYMVGGIPFFPSEMMEDLLHDLESLQEDLMNNTRFRKKSFFFNVSSGNSSTIIKYLNDEASQNHSVALHDLEASGDKITTIQMTSSWIF